eukprot:TRINITY_DN4508_c0_g1_i2.p1 TRINITY_DN4508_c0_g1~~TRINITY_DN4508_c0_g1_i2.p1  ORF type:complete len:104 (-),score=19.76 TRINITY_DN4508_c0_g1_i2:24-299(-)
MKVLAGVFGFVFTPLVLLFSFLSFLGVRWVSFPGALVASCMALSQLQVMIELSIVSSKPHLSVFYNSFDFLGPLFLLYLFLTIPSPKSKKH